MSTGSYVVERCGFGLSGVAYLRSYFAPQAEFGNLLASLLARRELEAGSTWAFLPAGSSARAGLNFKAGGLASRTDLLDQAVIEWVAAALESCDPAPVVFCVEESLTKRHHLVRPPSELALPTFLCGDSVFHYACSRDCLAPVVRSARGAYWKPNVGILTKRPGTLENITPGQEVSSGALEEMAGAARAIIVGAWDVEGHLIWEP